MNRPLGYPRTSVKPQRIHDDNVQSKPAARDNSPRSIVTTALLVFCSCQIGLTLLAWGLSFIDRGFLHRGFPFNTPLYDPGVHFTDLTDFYDRIRNLEVGGRILGGGRVPFNYPPAAL